MLVQVGKRLAAYRDTGEVDEKGIPKRETLVEVLILKPGDCDLNFGGIPLELVEPKVLPSAD